jgi:hypothetical protein
VLGVPTISYLPFCFFNLLSPVISLLYAVTGFRLERIEGSGATGSPEPADEAVSPAVGAAEGGGAPA